MKISPWLAVSAVVVLAACASPPAPRKVAGNHAAKAPQQTVAASSDESKTDDPDRVVCTYKKKIGSHFPQKQCMTVRQMKKRQAESRNSVRNAQRGGPTGGGG